MENDNYFINLYQVDVSKWIEKKNGLSYLSWANAWAEVKKRHPDAFYTIYENENGWNYFTDGRTCWVKTGVTVNNLEHIEYLPVMDYRNQSIPLDKVTSFNVNTSVQRSLTKACARHGIGLYIYAGEDLPEAVFEPMTDEQRSKLIDLGANLDDIASYLKVISVDEISSQQADALIKAKIAKLAKEANNE